MNELLQDIGKIPISDEHPAGEEARYSPEYEKMAEEIAKISSLQGEASVNWTVVRDMAAEILRSRAKDIAAAVYLSIALGRTEGLEGWCTGTTVLCDVLSSWWEDGFPKLSRMRARLNILKWWQEQSLIIFERTDDPLTPPLYAQIQDAISIFDGIAAEKDLDIPPNRELREWLSRLEVSNPEPAKEPEPIPETSPAPSPDLISPAETTDPPRDPEKKLPVQKAIPPLPHPPAEDAKDAAEAAARLCDAANLYLSYAFIEECPTSVLPWKALYIALWGRIASLPPAENGVTLLPPPDGERLEALQKLARSGNDPAAALAAVRFAPESPFCLTPHRIIENALKNMGGSYASARAAVCGEILLFLRRLPGAEQLCFSDSSPFADPQTLQWVRDLQRESAGNDTTPEDPVETILLKSRGLFRKDKAEEALTLLHQAARNPQFGGSASVRFRTEALSGVLRLKQSMLLTPMATELEKVLQDMERWDAEETAKSLAVLHDVWRFLNRPEKASCCLERLTSLAPGSALRLAKALRE
ncbi:MAG: type VI secretion system domain-containing protein [Desulfovibrionaceae bacterium]|nr:type VI secretion system domain-containing protein [Desulfovibrionaceae bacterium]